MHELVQDHGHSQQLVRQLGQAPLPASQLPQHPPVGVAHPGRGGGRGVGARRVQQRRQLLSAYSCLRVALRRRVQQILGFSSKPNTLVGGNKCNEACKILLFKGHLGTRKSYMQSHSTRRCIAACKTLYSTDVIPANFCGWDSGRLKAAPSASEVCTVLWRDPIQYGSAVLSTDQFVPVNSNPTIKKLIFQVCG